MNNPETVSKNTLSDLITDTKQKMFNKNTKEQGKEKQGQIPAQSNTSSLVFSNMTSNSHIQQELPQQYKTMQNSRVVQNEENSPEEAVQEKK